MVKIVVFEAEASRRRALRQALCGEGHAVHEAEGSEAAAVLVENFNPDVVLVDMHRSVALGTRPVGQIFLHHDVARDAPVVFFAPADYSTAGRVWTPNLSCCRDGSLFGALPDHVRHKTLEHVRRVCLSLSRCKHMMTDAAHSDRRGSGRNGEYAVAA